MDPPGGPCNAAHLGEGRHPMWGFPRHVHWPRGGWRLRRCNHENPKVPPQLTQLLAAQERGGRA